MICYAYLWLFLEFPVSKDCWHLIISVSRRHDYTTLQPWKLQSVLPHLFQIWKWFSILIPVTCFPAVSSLGLVIFWWQCRDGTSPLLPGQLCRLSLTRTGAFSRGIQHDQEIWVLLLLLPSPPMLSDRRALALLLSHAPCPGWVTISSLILVNCLFPGRVVCMAWKHIKVLTRKQPGFYLANSFYRSKASTATAS